jgi:hypothetical protein
MSWAAQRCSMWAFHPSGHQRAGGPQAGRRSAPASATTTAATPPGRPLRLTLGSLLADELGISLRRVGTAGGRLTFGAGEAVLSDWMAEHACVCWTVDPEPWQKEAQMLRDVDLPLNLDQNAHSGFHASLKQARARQRELARSLPALPR